MVVVLLTKNVALDGKHKSVVFDCSISLVFSTIKHNGMNQNKKTNSVKTNFDTILKTLKLLP